MIPRAFTLLELLIVVTVVAILATLALSVVGMVRAGAHSAVCAVRMRDQGIAMSSYATDLRGFLPPTYLDNATLASWPSMKTREPHRTLTTEGNGWEAWFSYLSPYLGRDQRSTIYGPKALGLDVAYNCPAAEIQVRFDAQIGDPPRFRWEGRTLFSASTSILCMSYGMNTAVLSSNASVASGTHPNRSRGLQGWPGYGVGLPGMQDNRKRTASFINPSGTILLAEHRGQAPNSTMGSGGLPHVRLWFTDPPFVRPPRGDSGTILPVPAGWTWSTTAVGTWPWTNDNFDGVALRANHRNRSNYLFVDGHVESRTPWELCPDGSPNNAPAWTGRF